MSHALTGQLHPVTVGAPKHPVLVHTSTEGQFVVSHQMGVLPVHRDEQIGIGRVVQGQQLVGLAMAGGVHTELAAVDQPGAPAGQRVMQSGHRGLVTGNGVRREHHSVGVAHRHEPVASLPHQVQRGPRLALGAGTHDAGAGRVQVIQVAISDQHLVGDVQQPQLTGQRRVTDHRRPHDDQLAARGRRGVGHLLDAMHMAGERADDDPAALVLIEHLTQHRTDSRLRRRRSGRTGIGRIGQQQADAPVGGDLANPIQVGNPAVDGRRVQLEITRVENAPLGRMEHRHQPAGRGVGDGQELAVEGTNGQTVVVAQRNQIGHGHAGELQLAAHHPEGKRRAVDGQGGAPLAEGPEQVRQSTDVVLVGVGDHAGLKTVGPLQQPVEVGQHGVDAGHVVGKELTAVEHHDAAVDLEGRTVAADLAEAAEKRQVYGCCHGEDPRGGR